MANIKNHLNNIKNALFGQEVRGSIHDGIDAINKEVESTTGRQVDLEKTFDQLVINAGNSNAEIVDARVKSDGTSYSKLGDRLNEVDSQLEHNMNEINEQFNTNEKIINKIANNKNEQFRETFTLYSNTSGCYESASSLSVLTNNDEGRPQVLGISPETDYVLATYTARDSVSIYSSITANEKLSFNYNVNHYTVNSVVLNDDISKSIKVGMIIDTKHSPKFSGMISDIDVENKIIYVYNWYQEGNTNKGQIPSNDFGIIVNPVTTIWNINTNLHTPKSDKPIGGIVAELDIINDSDDNIVKGIDIATHSSGAVEHGIALRRANQNCGKYKKAIVVDGANDGLCLSDTTTGVVLAGVQKGIYSANVPVYHHNVSSGNNILISSQDTNGLPHFVEYADGSRTCLKSTRIVHSKNGVISNNGFFVLMTADGTLPPPSENSNCIMILYAVLGYNPTVTYYSSGYNQTHQLTSETAKMFMSDGTNWIKINL